MATLLRRPKILIRYGRQQQPIRVPSADLIVDSVAKTYLSTDIASGSSTLTVQSISSFAVNQILMIGEPGNQNTEIIKTHASSAPSGTTITLASNTVYSHSNGTTVYLVGFDQVEISTATTLTGAKSVLTTTAITPTLDFTEYNDTAASSGFYFARWKETIGNTFSSYSDGAPVGGYTFLTARYIIDSAIKGINKTQSDLISDEYCFLELNNYQTEVLREQKRWQFLQKFNTNVGTTLTGTWSLTAPSDMDDQYTNKSVWNFRIAQEPSMTFVDKEKWDEITSMVVSTTLAAILNVGDPTMTLANSGDFGASGTVQIGSATYSFTSNNTSTNVLTLSSVVTSGNNQSNGAQVFMNMSFGEPRVWTIFQGTLYHYPGISSTYTARGYYLDYYKSQTVILNDTDSVVIPDQTAAIYYLQWKLLVRMNNGEETDASLAKKALHDVRKTNIKNKDSIGRTFRLKPMKNTLDETDFPGNDPRWQRVAGWYRP